MSAGDPFASSKRSLKLRSVLLVGGAVLLLVGSVYFYSRSRRSAILIQTQPNGVTVTINNQEVAFRRERNAILVPVIAGQYRLEVTKPNHVPFVQDVRVPVGETVRIRPVFTLVPETVERTNQGGISFVRPVLEEGVVYYVGDNGTRFYRMNTATQQTYPISERSVRSIQDIQWPRRADVALIRRDDGVYLFEVPLFDFRTQRLDKVAGNEFLSPVWDPKSERVASALFLPTGERSLVTSDKRFTTLSRKAELTGFTNPKLVWSPDSRFIAVINRSSQQDQNHAWIYNLATGDFDRITANGSVVDVSFSPDESHLLIERANQQLSVRPLGDQNEFPVSISGTVATAAWHGSHFYLPTQVNGLARVTTTGRVSYVPFALPNTHPIQSLLYFPTEQVLVAATNRSVYTISMEF
jgi:hypothetical protein